ncbi:anti-sigma F factor [Domibacillus enclensis]|uniref:Anti-sigma F factor n=1 Tax=Domibacillus enclensis TaxID=1017273 RepID=A0A1N6PDG9_9BACI|nr:anti-sigma F factor [Domibacillus enclensis]OXS80323.1 anti-sigma F factor [Domibacillus enclensis]SIQ02297.1 stage II sporulation protein AB (anti-sigma F factor) [Domibacillus enclensis]
MQNAVNISFNALGENEAFARVAVASFAAKLNPTVDDLAELKTAVSEAVTNAIIHGYDSNPAGMVYISATIEDGEIDVVIRDEGRGIDNIEEAKEPLFTTKPEMERAGMGFTIMEHFTDRLEVESSSSSGTVVRFKKRLAGKRVNCV